MHSYRVALVFGILAAGVATLTRPAVAEDYRGTFAQRMACTPDVFRLCGSEIPDVGRIVACLRQNQTQLGAPCRAVFESNAEATGDDVAAKATGSPVGPHGQQ
ncbi:cysteine rich repeat-containing protein [Nitrobacter sp.]|uniref:cysteine rich repeat-containing protein n=1 Tax=Nitrobacter sp. TaxID=29420 RepID=UPI003F64BFD8